jgi:uncharacterized membrane-anchored protein
VLELRLDLIACETGLTIWSATAWVDSADNEARIRILEWQAQLLGGSGGDDRLRVQAIMESPERLARFAVHQLAGLL